MKSTWIVLFLAACGSSSPSNPDAHPGDGPVSMIDGGTASRTVFVIPLENEPSSKIYGNTVDAPYLNSLLASAARATMFQDELPALVSEPHYIWMEAGTNAFADKTFTTDADASASNSTASTAHLVTQLDTAGIPWMSYQQGITSHTCPISSAGVYAPKHDPFVFFKDISGTTPSASATACSAHHKAYTDFAPDLQAGLTGYVFITPDLCHDMHGDSSCPQGTGVAANIKAGDTWLSTELPAIIAYAASHEAVIYLTWDEGDSTNVMAFLALGSHVKTGSTSSTVYNHGSLVKSVEEYLGVPVLPSVAGNKDFVDLFQPGTFP